MNIKVLLLVAIVWAFLGWSTKAYQDRNDIRPKLKIGQKVAIKYLEEWVDDGGKGGEKDWYRNERKYLSGGKAVIVGIEWWPSQHKEMSYWVGSTDPDYKAFVGVKESDIIVW